MRFCYFRAPLVPHDDINVTSSRATAPTLKFKELQLPKAIPPIPFPQPTTKDDNDPPSPQQPDWSSLQLANLLHHGTRVEADTLQRGFINVLDAPPPADENRQPDVAGYAEALPDGMLQTDMTLGCPWYDGPAAAHGHLGDDSVDASMLAWPATLRHEAAQWLLATQQPTTIISGGDDVAVPGDGSEEEAEIDAAVVALAPPTMALATTALLLSSKATARDDPDEPADGAALALHTTPSWQVFVQRLAQSSPAAEDVLAWPSAPDAPSVERFGDYDEPCASHDDVLTPSRFRDTAFTITAVVVTAPRAPLRTAPHADEDVATDLGPAQQQLKSAIDGLMQGGSESIQPFGPFAYVWDFLGGTLRALPKKRALRFHPIPFPPEFRRRRQEQLNAVLKALQGSDDATPLNPQPALQYLRLADIATAPYARPPALPVLTFSASQCHVGLAAETCGEVPSSSAHSRQSADREGSSSSVAAVDPRRCPHPTTPHRCHVACGFSFSGTRTGPALNAPLPVAEEILGRVDGSVVPVHTLLLVDRGPNTDEAPAAPDATATLASLVPHKPRWERTLAEGSKSFATRASTLLVQCATRFLIDTVPSRADAYRRMCRRFDRCVGAAECDGPASAQTLEFAFARSLADIASPTRNTLREQEEAASVPCLPASAKRARSERSESTATAAAADSCSASAPAPQREPSSHPPHHHGDFGYNLRSAIGTGEGRAVHLRPAMPSSTSGCALVLSDPTAVSLACAAALDRRLAIRVSAALAERCPSLATAIRGALFAAYPSTLSDAESIAVAVDAPLPGAEEASAVGAGDNDTDMAIVVTPTCDERGRCYHLCLGTPATIDREADGGQNGVEAASVGVVPHPHHIRVLVPEAAEAAGSITESPVVQLLLRAERCDARGLAEWRTRAMPSISFGVACLVREVCNLHCSTQLPAHLADLEAVLQAAAVAGGGPGVDAALDQLAIQGLASLPDPLRRAIDFAPPHPLLEALHALLSGQLLLRRSRRSNRRSDDGGPNGDVGDVSALRTAAIFVIVGDAPAFSAAAARHCGVAAVASRLQASHGCPVVFTDVASDGAEMANAFVQGDIVDKLDRGGLDIVVVLAFPLPPSRDATTARAAAVQEACTAAGLPVLWGAIAGAHADGIGNNEVPNGHTVTAISLFSEVSASGEHVGADGASIANRPEPSVSSSEDHPPALAVAATPLDSTESSTTPRPPSGPLFVVFAALLARQPRVVASIDRAVSRSDDASQSSAASSSLGSRGSDDDADDTIRSGSASGRGAGHVVHIQDLWRLAVAPPSGDEDVFARWQRIDLLLPRVGIAIVVVDADDVATLRGETAQEAEGQAARSIVRAMARVQGSSSWRLQLLYLAGGGSGPTFTGGTNVKSGASRCAAIAAALRCRHGQQAGVSPASSSEGVARLVAAWDAAADVHSTAPPSGLAALDALQLRRVQRAPAITRLLEHHPRVQVPVLRRTEASNAADR